MHTSPRTKVFRIIVNPVAGKGRGAYVGPFIEKNLTRLGLDFEILTTARPMHAAELAEDACMKGYGAVVSVGGDGTSNEVINGLMGARARGGSDCAMGLIRVGTGNDFAFGAGIPAGIERECEVLASGARSMIDIGKITGGDYPDGRYFGNGIGIGFDARVGFKAHEYTWGKGAVPYILGAAVMLIRYTRPPLLKLEYDGTVITERLPQVSVMNGCRMGGAFKMAPDAVMDDGLLNLCIVREVGRLRLLYFTAHYVFGTQYGRPGIIAGRARAMTVTALEGSMAIHADGETICTEGTNVRIEVAEKALEIIRPLPL